MVDKTKDGLWMSKMKLKKGALKKELHVKEGHHIPLIKLREALKSKNPKERERAQFAKNMRGLHK